MSAILQVMQDVDRELERFFAIDEARRQVGKVTDMPVCIVDDRWHQLIKDGQIDSFVASRFGDDVQIEHVKAPGSGQLDWIEDYERMFGPLDPVWFTKSTGMDVDAYGLYETGRSLEFSWDCRPGKPLTFSWDCRPGRPSR